MKFKTSEQEVAGSMAQSVKFKTSEQEVAGSIAQSVAFRTSAASGLERMLYGVMVKTTPEKHGSLLWPRRYNQNTVENGVKNICLAGMEPGIFCSKVPTELHELENGAPLGQKCNTILFAFSLLISSVQIVLGLYDINVTAQPHFVLSCIYHPCLNSLFTLLSKFELEICDHGN